MKTKKLTFGAMCLAISLLLPQVFHIIGMQQAGSVFLPMHLPVFIGGMLLGPIYGLFLGIFAPLTSFVEKMDMTQQFLLNSMNHQQALGAYVVVDKDYPFIHMILLIIDNLLNDVKSTIQNQINEMIRHLQEQFPQATISTVSVIASDHAPQEDQIQQMESQIIEKQMDMNQSFEQKTKEYYQSILYN